MGSVLRLARTMRVTCAGSIAGLALFVGIVLPAADRAGLPTSGLWVISSAWADQPAGCIPPQNAGSGFLRWLDSGGPDQAGLPRGSMDALGRSTRAFLDDVVRLCSRTAAVADAWSGMSGPDDTALIAASPTLLNLLGAVTETSSAAMRSAVANKIQVAAALALVDRSIQEEQRRQPELQTQLREAQQRLQSAQAELQNARNELEGEKGFLNGFLTGITFGAYNPLKENLDRAHRSVDGINREIESINRQREVIALRQQELEQKRQLLDVIGRMDLTVTDFQNSVNQAQDPLSRARENFEKSGSRDLPALAKLYLRRARTAMTDLSGWVATFNSVIRQLALGNRAPSMNCVTTITECKVTS